MTTTDRKTEAAVLAQAFRDLPQRPRCPRCKKGRPKNYFGVRILARDADGLPRTVRRQSW
ncbi:MAG: hypothetical protein IT380_09925 [Myxococcales bacterium]|nr:hypothetical protein [Myxococcales bacterium]